MCFPDAAARFAEGRRRAAAAVHPLRLSPPRPWSRSSRDAGSPSGPARCVRSKVPPDREASAASLDDLLAALPQLSPESRGDERSRRRRTLSRYHPDQLAPFRIVSRKSAPPPRALIPSRLWRYCGEEPQRRPSSLAAEASWISAAPSERTRSSSDAKASWRLGVIGTRIVTETVGMGEEQRRHVAAL